jgi:hypothetical protein
VIVRHLGVIDDRDGDLGAVARGDDGLVGLRGDPAAAYSPSTPVSPRSSTSTNVFDPRSMRPTPSTAAK